MAAAPDEKTDYIRPDQARRILEEDENYNAIFRKVYASCTSLSREELEKITDSETGRVIYPVLSELSLFLPQKGVTKIAAMHKITARKVMLKKNKRLIFIINKLILTLVM